MLYAVQIARKTLEQIKPQICRDYVELWQKDLMLWETRLKNLEQVPKVQSIPDALGWLGLKTSTCE